MSDTKDSLNSELHSAQNDISLKDSITVEETKNILALVNSTRESLAGAEEFVTSAKQKVQEKLQEVQDISTQSLAAKTKIEDLQTVVASKSDHIEKAQEHADKVRANLDRALTAANQNITEAEAIKIKVQSESDTVHNISTSINTLKATIDAKLVEIEEIKQATEQSSLVTHKLAKKSEDIEENLSTYEDRLAEMNLLYEEKLTEITSLLPGATSAGLAHAFHARAKKFVTPHWIWQGIFMFSIVANVLLAGIGLWHFLSTGTTPSYDELGRFFLTRAPVAGLFIWLAIHASREAALAKRLEEDYAYKAAIADSFLGFNKQMAEISNSREDTPLAQLCSNTLTIIATQPGRIYESHPLAFSPAEEIRKQAKNLETLAKEAKSLE